MGRYNRPNGVAARFCSKNRLVWFSRFKSSARSFSPSVDLRPSSLALLSESASRFIKPLSSPLADSPRICPPRRRVGSLPSAAEAGFPAIAPKFAPPDPAGPLPGAPPIMPPPNPAPEGMPPNAPNAPAFNSTSLSCLLRFMGLLPSLINLSFLSMSVKFLRSSPNAPSACPKPDEDTAVSNHMIWFWILGGVSLNLSSI